MMSQATTKASTASNTHPTTSTLLLHQQLYPLPQQSGYNHNHRQYTPHQQYYYYDQKQQKGYSQNYYHHPPQQQQNGYSQNHQQYPPQQQSYYGEQQRQNSYSQNYQQHPPQQQQNGHNQNYHQHPPRQQQSSYSQNHQQYPLQEQNYHSEQQQQNGHMLNHWQRPPQQQQKRKSELIEPPSIISQPNKKRSTAQHTIQSTAGSLEQQQNEERKPRLQTPDVEFDYDRSQLRDPRPTPGRKSRPRYTSYDLPPQVKAHLEATREFPGPPPQWKGRRKNAAQDNELQTGCLESSHSLHCCFKKGRHGSPTYDEAGYQLDFAKVLDWMRPKAYSKSRVVRGMENTLARMESERTQIFDVFFVERPDKAKWSVIEDYVKDHVSKDIGVPWHQIGPREVKLWREKGFKPVVFEEWWKVPNAEEDKRLTKMLCGASLRKDL